MNHSVRLSNTERRRRAITIAIVGCILLVLPSCGIPTVRRPDPAPPLPNSFNGVTTPDNSSQLGIEQFFNEPMLTGLIQQALAGNQELKILAQDVQIASNEILARRGAYLPFVTVGGNAALDKPSLYTLDGAVENGVPFAPGKFFPDPLPNFMLGANLYWQLDIWRQLRNARDAAAMRFFASNEGRNYAVTKMVAEIAENYYQLMALDKRLEILDQTIALQEQSRSVAEKKMEAARGDALAVQRFEAEVRKNQSEKLIVAQEIIEVENRINFLVGRFPQPVERMTGNFIDLNLHVLSLGVPAQLLQNRPDIRQAERELASAGLDVQVARFNFFPKLIINGGVGYQAFNPKYLFTSPEALIYNIAGDLVAPLVNRKAIQAEYSTANARQLQSVYNYQRVVINAFTEVINRMSKVENYRKSIELKKQQLKALEESVDIASKLFQRARADYVDVLFAQRDMMDARTVLVETKQQQLAAIINTYQALGGGNLLPVFIPDDPQPHHWWQHRKHAEVTGRVQLGPMPLPAQVAAAGRGPVQLPPTAPADSDPKKEPSTPSSDNDSEKDPSLVSDPEKDPSTPPADSDPEKDPSTPAEGNDPDPLPPAPMSGEEEPGTVPNTDDPPM
jgi:multidrug efflux system outer membrane protein